MGIKFRCPICDKKIHVKSYLAGKRGLCPACGAKVTIPTDSGDEDDEGALDEHASRVDLTVPGDVDPLAQTTISQGPSPVPELMAAHQAATQHAGETLPEQAVPQAAVPQAAYPQAAAPQAGIPQPAYPQAAVPMAGIPQAAVPQAAVPMAGIPQAAIPQAGIPQAAIPQAAVPQAAVPMAAIPQAAVPMAAIPPVIAPPAMPTAPPVAPPLPAAKKSTRDILAEDPNASWYVRLSSGDQFGPAKGPDMTEWLAEGRVQPDALVWREGWADWKRAEYAFPQLRDEEGGVAVAPPPKPIVAKAVAAAPVGLLVKRDSDLKSGKPQEEDTAELLKSVGDNVEPAPSSSRSSGSTYTPPPKSNAGTVAAVVGGLAVVVIAPLLVYVLISQPSGSGGGGGILSSVTGPSWESHSGPGFTARFPMHPRESSQSEMTPAGAFKGTRYLADHRNNSGYAFSVTAGEVVDPAAATARLDDFCQESAANAAKAIPGGVVSKGEPIPGFTGREYKITSEVVGDHVLIRVILAGKRRFTVAVQAQGSKTFDAPIVEQFLNSFKLTEAGEPEKKRKG